MLENAFEHNLFLSQINGIVKAVLKKNSKNDKIKALSYRINAAIKAF